jgi:hypothetical protein
MQVLLRERSGFGRAGGGGVLRWELRERSARAWLDVVGRGLAQRMRDLNAIGN